MRLISLTLLFNLTEIFFCENYNPVDYPPLDGKLFYNIHSWVAQLNLQRCSLVEIGNKYFAIFVEDAGRRNHRRIKHYFLGICNLEVLSEWKFCTPELQLQQKHKCQFILHEPQYAIRIHRRFCDIKLMQENKDCKCENTLLGQEMYKVEGFPTCSVSPLPYSLCKYYSPCGLSGCKTTTLEDRVHAVQCNPRCLGRRPFCELVSANARTARFPKVTSFWSDWKDVQEDGESLQTRRVIRSIATCRNKYTGKGAVDCLGPGTSCCPQNSNVCSCETFVENGVLKVEREYTVKNNINTLEESNGNLNKYRKIVMRRMHKKPQKIESRLTNENIRYIRDTDEDLEDDEEDEDDNDEDIAIEENTEKEATVCTKESLEKDEIDELQPNTLNGTKNIKQDGLYDIIHGDEENMGNFLSCNILLVILCILVRSLNYNDI